ncbi:MAG: hypothetical protein IJM85_01945 [Clostridia bacterium]|nr:hypothetical protein [Clostridia bacterium]
MSRLNDLWEYQSRELQLLKLTKEMKSSPAYQKKTKLHKILTDHQNRIHEYEEELKSHTEQIAALETQLSQQLHEYELENSELETMQQDEEVTAEELTESRKSIEKLCGRINALNRDLTKLIAWCEEITQNITKTFSDAKRAKLDYDAVRTVCDAEKENFAPKINELKKELEERKASIPPELMKEYEALRKNYSMPVAKVASGQCTGCYMKLSSVVEKRVASGSAIVRCENCGRLLFME